MAKKVIDPAPIIKELADRCLVAKGLECSILGAVIDRLRAAPAECNAPYWSTEAAYKNGYEAGKPKWIPVGERLPEDQTPVIGWDAELRDMGIVSFAFGQFLDIIDLSEVNITHWMPLPEPP